ncbi:MAG: glycosyltransferase [Alloprevotella sp.]|nr:glycosyltransferase [Alloprevotella sp.]
MSQDTTPLVSVVIPAYNMQDYIGETLRSVLASHYLALEVVVVDDGSTDGTPDIVRRIAAEDSRLRVFRVENGGVCRARNKGCAEARGEFILPIDADDTIEPDLIGQAVAAMAAPDVAVAVPGGDFFGARTGRWTLPPYSLRLLARKNMIPASALFRRADWGRTGGYCEEIIAREDWEFWIHLLKDGGRVVQLPGCGLHYRIRSGSKRASDRRLKRHVVRVLNRRHPEFFERMLGGPLRYHRSWSRTLNRLHRLLHPRHAVLAEGHGGLRYWLRTLPAQFRHGGGEVIYKGRNELRRFAPSGEEVVVKSFRIPHLLNRIAYGTVRPSKAERSFRYARQLREWGIGTPEPVGWMTVRNGLLLAESYYACRRSCCRYSYADLIGGRFPGQERYLRAIGRAAARLHEHGAVHRDFSRGNILFDDAADGGVLVEFIDLNRLRFRAVSLEEGCRNLSERLPATPDMIRAMAQGYAEGRGADAAECLRLMQESPREAS